MEDPVRNPYISPTDIGQPISAGREMSLLQYVRTGQLITFALIMGLLIMAGILSMTAVRGQAADDESQIFVKIGLGLGAAACVVSYVLMVFLRSRALAKFRQRATAADLTDRTDQVVTPAVSELMANAMRATIVGQSVLDGAAVINIVFMVLDHSPFHLAVAAVMMFGIALQTPTVAKRRSLIEQGLR